MKQDGLEYRGLSYNQHCIGVGYDGNDLKKLDDKDNPLNPINQQINLMKKFLDSHPGFERDDLQDYLNLFCFITNTRGNPLLKAKKMIYLSYINKNIAKGDISFMLKEGERSLFAKYIANRSDIDLNGMFDIVAHGNSDLIEIENGNKTIQIKAREAAKLIRKQSGFKKAKSIRLFSCNTGSTVNGFAQNLANALGKPVYAPNMTLYSNNRGNYWISNGINKGEFIKFIPGGYKNGK